jgi:protein farnesyltransferase subunit beta
VPRRRPDSYHTCYTLAGLSSLQYSHYYRCTAAATSYLASDFAWDCRHIPSDSDDFLEKNVFDESDRLRPLHPVYVIPHEAVVNMQVWAERQG